MDTTPEIIDAVPAEAILPADMDAEGVILSYALEVGPIGGLLPQHFYADAHRYIYEAVQTIAARGEPLDVVAAARELRANGRLEQVGGHPYLCQLITHTPAAANVLSHAAAVRELYRRRVLAGACEALRTELQHGAVTSQGAWTRFKELCDVGTAT